MAIKDNPAASPVNQPSSPSTHSAAQHNTGARSSIFRTKTIEQSIAETHEEGFKLKRELRTIDLIVFGVSVVIGAGIFTMTAQVAGDMAGPAVSIAFVLAAITCGLATLCYAEFASTVPVAGSAYTFSFATFGEFVAWIIGWDLVLEFFVAAAVVAKAWSSYASGLFGSDDLTLWTVGGLQVDWGAALLVIVLGALLARGTKLSSRVSVIITAIKLTVVLFVIVVGGLLRQGGALLPIHPRGSAQRIRHAGHRHGAIRRGLPGAHRHGELHAAVHPGKRPLPHPGYRV